MPVGMNIPVDHMPLHQDDEVGRGNIHTYAIAKHRYIIAAGVPVSVNRAVEGPAQRTSRARPPQERRCSGRLMSRVVVVPRQKSIERRRASQQVLLALGHGWAWRQAWARAAGRAPAAAQFGKKTACRTALTSTVGMESPPASTSSRNCTSSASDIDSLPVRSSALPVFSSAPGQRRRIFSRTYWHNCKRRR